MRCNVSGVGRPSMTVCLVEFLGGCGTHITYLNHLSRVRISQFSIRALILGTLISVNHLLLFMRYPYLPLNKFFHSTQELHRISNRFSTHPLAPTSEVRLWDYEPKRCASLLELL